jgi:predicted RNase H-like nuclease (RuvC/YqgF family)
MDKLIQPLSDVLKQYPDLSAKIIVIVSAIFSALATAYVFLQEQAKGTLRERLETQRQQAVTYEDDRKRMSEQIEKIQEIVQSKTELTLNLERLNEETNELKRKNLDMEGELQLARLQENLNQMIAANQADVTAIKKAILTQEDRRSAFRKVRKDQKKKNIFSLFRKR